MDWKNPDIAAKYKPGETMTGPFGLHLVKQAGLDRADGSEDLVILDNASGTGIATVHLYDSIPAVAKSRLHVVCGDISPAMVTHIQERITQNGWIGATAKVINAQNMDLPSNHFTHVITNFAIVGVPDPRAVLSEIFRVLRPSGTAALTIWKHVGWFPITAAAVATIPGAPRFPVVGEFSNAFLKDKGAGGDCWIKREFFEKEIRKAGFEDIKTVLQENVTKYKNGAEYVQTFSVMTKQIMENFWNAEEQGRVDPHLDKALVDELERRFGEGEVTLDWQAYCITAKVPAMKA